MAYYEVSGKWYHLSYSHGFREVVVARTPRAAIIKFAYGLDGADEPDDITWDWKPVRVKLGQLELEPTFWIGGDQMYKVRHVAQVKPEIVECPECRGEGKVRGFVPVDDVREKG